MPGPFPYRQGFGSTPAPACEITIGWRGVTRTLAALIDSGASGTLIPISLVSELQLRKTGEQRVSGYDQRVEIRGRYAADLELFGVALPSVPVVAIPQRAYVLIGRNILNRYTTTLYGRELQFSLD